jgi:putative DNA-binding protein
MLPADISSRDPGEKPSYGAAFSGALIDPERAIPNCVAGPNGKTATKRYNVYRNNVTVSLIEALASIYPAVQRITGAEFFRAMARFHVRANPPRSPLLFEYGRDFPDFIERYEYAQSVPWLGDVARIERAWLDCYHAADAEPLSATALGSVPADRLAKLVFQPHPAVRIVCSSFSSVSIFAANRNVGRAAPVNAVDPEDALITRPGQDVAVRHLPAGGAAFLTRLIEGTPLAVAASAALEVTPSFDLAANIVGMIDAGVFATIKDGDPR